MLGICDSSVPDPETQEELIARCHAQQRREEFWKKHWRKMFAAVCISALLYSVAIWHWVQSQIIP